MAIQPVVQGWKPLYDEHRRLGGRRASLALPIAIVLGLILALAIGYALVAPDAEAE
jgi:hypothetical protein